MPENKIAKALRIIGYVVIGGGIIGSFILGEMLGTTETYGYYYTYSEVVFNWTVTLTGIFSSVVSGSLFIGFSHNDFPFASVSNVMFGTLSCAMFSRRQNQSFSTL